MKCEESPLKKMLEEEGFKGVSADMCYVASVYGVRGVETILDYAFRYSCIEYERHGMEMAGEIFHKTNMFHRGRILRRIVKQTRRDIWWNPNRGVELSNFSDQDVLKAMEDNSYAV